MLLVSVLVELALHELGYSISSQNLVIARGLVAVSSHHQDQKKASCSGEHVSFVHS
jgi:hypothetical protein